MNKIYILTFALCLLFLGVPVGAQTVTPSISPSVSPTVSPTPSPTSSTVTVNIMKHLCPSSITNKSQFDALGGFADKEKACPTAVRLGQQRVAGTILGGLERDFNFSVRSWSGSQWNQKTTADDFIQGKNCETELSRDLNNNGVISATECADASYYAYKNIYNGRVEIEETSPIFNSYIGAVEFTPVTLGGKNDQNTFVSLGNGVITLDTTKAQGGNVLVHVFDFQKSQAEVDLSKLSPQTLAKLRIIFSLLREMLILFQKEASL